MASLVLNSRKACSFSPQARRVAIRGRVQALSWPGRGIGWDAAHPSMGANLAVTEVRVTTPISSQSALTHPKDQEAGA